MISSKKTAVFVCSKKGGCGAKGSKKFIKKLKSEIKDQGLKKDFTVMECSCLGFCKKGIAVMSVPAGRSENLIALKIKPKEAADFLIELRARINKSGKAKLKLLKPELAV